jgi:hypothetical protein
MYLFLKQTLIGNKYPENEGLKICNSINNPQQEILLLEFTITLIVPFRILNLELF